MDISKQKEKLRAKILQLEKINRNLFPLDAEKKIIFNSNREEIRILDGQWGALDREHKRQMKRAEWFWKTSKMSVDNFLNNDY